MNSLVDDKEFAHLYEPCLIPSDSQRSWNAVRDAVKQHLAPRNFVEHMLAAELVHAEWETLQSRRFKSLILTSARLPAVKALLTMLLENSGATDIDELSERFFTNKSVRRKVGKILFSYGLTEANIDAEAYRQSLDELAQINRRLAELASRRDRILYLFDEHRAGLAVPCQQEAPEDNGDDFFKEER
jgi:hypothetical protein